MPCTAQPVTSDSARGMNGRPPLWCLLIKGELPIFLNPAERVVRIRAVLPRHCANSGDRYGVCLGPAGPFSPPITHGGSRSLLVLMICPNFINRGPGSSRESRILSQTVEVSDGVVLLCRALRRPRAGIGKSRPSPITGPYLARHVYELRIPPGTGDPPYAGVIGILKASFRSEIAGWRSGLLEDNDPVGIGPGRHVVHSPNV